MKIFAGHDEAGNIFGLAIPADDAREGEFDLVAAPGEYVSVVEVQDPRDKTKRQELLADLLRNYRVERSATAARLVKRAQAK